MKRNNLVIRILRWFLFSFSFFFDGILRWFLGKCNLRRKFWCWPESYFALETWHYFTFSAHLLHSITGKYRPSSISNYWFRITEFHLFLNSTPTKQKQNRHKTHFFKGHRKIGSINQMETIPHFKFHKPKLIFDIWNEKFSLLIAK